MFLIVLLFPPISTFCVDGGDHSRLKVRVLPVKMDVKIKRLKDIETVPAKMAGGNQELELIAEKVAAIESQTTADLKELLGRSDRFEVVEGTEADAVIECKISGYGKAKRAWTILLVGSGFFEGVFHGMIASSATGSQSFAVGVALAEIVSEAVKWGGGAYLFGKTFTPVIIETKLYSARSGKKIGKAIVLGVAGRKLMKGTTPEQKKDRSYKLSLVRLKAVDDTVRKIEKKLDKKAKKLRIEAANKADEPPSPASQGATKEELMK